MNTNFTSPLQISRPLFLIFALLAFFITILECWLIDYSKRIMPNWFNIYPLAVVGFSMYKTRLGREKTNKGLTWIGLSLCGIFMVEMVGLLFFPESPYHMSWLLYDLFLMTATVSLVSFIGERQTGALLSGLVLLVVVLHFIFSPCDFFSKYGIIWLFIVSWFIYLVASYRKRLDTVYANNLVVGKALEEQKDALRDATLKNREALRLLQSRHMQLIEQEKVLFYESLLQKLALEITVPVNAIMDSGANAKEYLRQLLLFLESHPEILEEQEWHELQAVTESLGNVFDGVRREAFVGRRRLEELSSRRDEAKEI